MTEVSAFTYFSCVIRDTSGVSKAFFARGVFLRFIYTADTILFHTFAYNGIDIIHFERDVRKIERRRNVKKI
jgi:hypothetical protein